VAVAVHEAANLCAPATRDGRVDGDDDDQIEEPLEPGGVSDGLVVVVNVPGAANLRRRPTLPAIAVNPSVIAVPLC